MEELDPLCPIIDDHPIQIGDHRRLRRAEAQLADVLAFLRGPSPPLRLVAAAGEQGGLGFGTQNSGL